MFFRIVRISSRTSNINSSWFTYFFSTRPYCILWAFLTFACIIVQERCFRRTNYINTFIESIVPYRSNPTRLKTFINRWREIRSFSWTILAHFRDRVPIRFRHWAINNFKNTIGRIRNISWDTFTSLITHNPLRVRSASHLTLLYWLVIKLTCRALTLILAYLCNIIENLSFLALYLTKFCRRVKKLSRRALSFTCLC